MGGEKENLSLAKILKAEYKQEKRTLYEISQDTGLSISYLLKSVNKDGEFVLAGSKNSHINITHNGKKYPLESIARKTGISYDTLYHRYKNYGDDYDEILKSRIHRQTEEPFSVNFDGIDLGKLSKKTGISKSTLRDRYKTGLRGKDLVKPLRKTKPVKIFIDGEEVFLSDLAKKSNIPYATLYSRWKDGVKEKDLFKSKEELVREGVFKQPTLEDLDGTRRSFSELANKYGISKQLLGYRSKKGLRGTDLFAPVKKNRVKKVRFDDDYYSFCELSKKVGIKRQTLSSMYERLKDKNDFEAKLKNKIRLEGK